jgi:hypothetical protein
VIVRSTRTHPAAAQPIHIWHRCHACGATPIPGRRFDCRTCPAGPDNSLCEPCHALFAEGRLAHPAPNSLAASLSISTHQFTAAEGTPRDAFDHWLRVEQPLDSAPTIGERFVVRPEFRARQATFWGSYAFVMVHEGRQLVVTALHVMDELAKSVGVDCTDENASYTGRELPNVVDDVVLYDVFADNWVFAELGSARPMLVLPDARVGSQEPYCQADIAAFVADPRTGLSAAPLAQASPEVGEPIWLVVNTGASRHGRTLAAVVVERTELTMIFRFAPGTAIPRFTSGAPLVNRWGEVVGINVGGGVVDEYPHGHAVHAHNIQRQLARGRP